MTAIFARAFLSLIATVSLPLKQTGRNRRAAKEEGSRPSSLRARQRPLARFAFGPATEQNPGKRPCLREASHGARQPARSDSPSASQTADRQSLVRQREC